MNTFAKLTAAAAVMGALAVPMATPSQAAWSHDHGYHHGQRGAAAAVGFGAGAVLGAAAANSAYGYDNAYDNGYAGDYAYGADTGYNSYASAGPTFGGNGGGAYDAYGPNAEYPYGYGVDSSNYAEHNCMVSPGSTRFTPCFSNR